jgi:hypothetical protein
MNQMTRTYFYIRRPTGRIKFLTVFLLSAFKIKYFANKHGEKGTLSTPRRLLKGPKLEIFVADFFYTNQAFMGT